MVCMKEIKCKTLLMLLLHRVFKQADFFRSITLEVKALMTFQEDS